MFCFKLKHLSELAENRGVISAQNREIQALKEQLVILESERRELLDFLLTANGAPALYNRSAPEVRPLAVTDPSPEQRLRRHAKARDWAAEAERLESEAFQTRQNF